MLKHIIKVIALFLLMVIATPSKAQTLYFPPLSGTEWTSVTPEALGWCTDHLDSLFHFLESNHTKAFIILSEGKIVVEAYFNGHDRQKPWYWASAGKTLTSSLIGIAQEEGKLNIAERTSTYLGNGWTSLTKEEEDLITIRHQLTMTTGLEDKGLDPYCTLPECLIKRKDPGERWAYHNAPYTLLDGVIEGATGIGLNQFMNDKIASKTGMSGFFLKSGYNNVYTSDARSMARFGLLISNQGYWDHNPVVPSEYVREMTSPSQDLNPAYGYLWWLNGSDKFLVPGLPFPFSGPIASSAPSDLISGMGKNGQFLGIVPSLDLVVIRLGENPDKSLVPLIFHNEMWQHISSVLCLTTSTTTQKDNILNAYPNPAGSTLNIPFANPGTQVTLSAPDGGISTFDYHGSALDVSELPPGCYFIRYMDRSGYYRHQQIVKTR